MRLKKYECYFSESTDKALKFMFDKIRFGIRLKKAWNVKRLGI